MSRPLRLALLATCVALPLPAAALTADELWQAWQDASGTAGQQVAAAETAREGGALVLTGVTASSPTPDGTVTARLDRLTLTERDDGSVAIAPDGPVTLEGSMTPAEGPAQSFTLEIAHEALDLVATGTPDALEYGISAGAITTTLTSLTEDGAAQPVDVAARIEDLAGAYSLGGPGEDATESSLTAARATTTVDATDPESGERVQIDASYDQLDLRSAGNLAGLQAAGGGGAILTEAAQAEGTLAYASSRTTLDVTSDTGTTGLVIASGAGTSHMGLERGVLSVDTTTNAIEVSASGDQVPFPQASATLEEARLALTLPLAATEEPRDFGLLLNLGGLRLDDALWAMLDPSQRFPRDPATVMLDLAGSGRLTQDLSSVPDGAAPPLELDGLTLKGLRIAVGGAELSGSGDFEFPAGGTQAGPGMAMPQGAANFTLTGGNALLDTLTSMGFLGDAEAMGARMMLGAFAQDMGNDRMESRIEIGPDGAITANGQRIR